MSGNSRRQVLSWAALATIVLVAGGLLGWALLSSRDAATTATLVGVVVSSATALAGWLWRQTRPVPAEPAGALANAADELATMVGQQWLTAAADRRLRHPAPVAVRWRWSRRPVTGSVTEALDGRFPALPGKAEVTADSLAGGGLADLADLYAGLGSGRLVILGGPGTGKTAAAIMMVMDCLEYRQGLDDQKRATVPVPVVLNPQGWDPGDQRLDDWLVRRITVDFPFLGNGTHGSDVAGRLVRERRIALFLDGFDEMVPELRDAAMRALNEQATFRLVVLTRTEEFADAVGTQHLHGAAALELLPVPATDAADYLTSCRVQPLPPAWQRLVDHLRAHPDSAQARAVDSPLTLSLVRDTYRAGDDVDELLDPARFATREDVEDHLLARVLPAAYEDRPGHPTGRYPLERARRWLGYIAERMNGQATRDLLWWRMHQWLPATERVAAAGLAGLLTATPLLWLAGLISHAVEDGLGLPGPVLGLIVGPLGGVAAGIAAERREPAADRAPLTARFNPAIGLATGLGVGIAVGFALSSGKAGLVPALPVGLGGGLMSCVVAGLASGLGRQRAGASLRGGDQRFRTVLTRRFNVAVGLAAGLPVGLAAWLTKGDDGNPLDERLFLAPLLGIAFTVAYGLLDGLSQAILSAAIPAAPMASWRQNRRYAVAVIIGYALPLGLGAALMTGVVIHDHHSLLAGLVMGPMLGAVVFLECGLAAWISSSETWRTRLVFLQLWRRDLGPHDGMRFLDDAHRRNVLRTAGPVYQFRHARLQDQLARPSSAPARKELVGG